jgi:hypothetical protein
MGINIGICELDAENSLCRELKKNIIKVKVDDVSRLEDVAEYEEYVTLEKAKEIFGDWEAFVKRNRLNNESDAVYISKVKKEEDLELLKPYITRTCTGWVVMEGLNPDLKKKALSVSKTENHLTGWDMIDFDEMNETCSKCPLSWDKGRGCIGTYGPDNSLLPGIAEKYGCEIIASAPESSKVKRIFTPEDGAKMLEEVKKLTEVLPDEGKMMVRRYGGPLERIQAVAEISVKEKCGFFFF